VWNQTTIDPTLGWGWNVSGSSVGIPNGFLSMRGKLNGTYGFGVGAGFEYQIVNSNGGNNSGTATVLAASTVSSIFNRVGGASNQGLYELEFNAADNAGQFIGDNNYPKKYQFLLDYSAPTNASITYNGTVTPGQPATGTFTGIDNYGLKYGRVGIRFDFPSTLFSGNQVYVPIGQIPIPAQQDGSPTKNLSMPITGTPPIGFRFFNPTSGAIDMSNFYRSNGGMWEVEDMAHNLSSITFAPFTNNAPIPTITNVSSVKASVSKTTWGCSPSCATEGENFVDLIFNYLEGGQSGTPSLTKAEWYGIPENGGGRVYPLTRAMTLTEAVEGTGRRLSYNVQFDMRKYCGPPGPMQVFVIGYNPGYYLKVNPFFSVNVQAQVRYSNLCNDF
jgi:hypothetical protein